MFGGLFRSFDRGFFWFFLYGRFSLRRLFRDGRQSSDYGRFFVELANAEERGFRIHVSDIQRMGIDFDLFAGIDVADDQIGEIDGNGFAVVIMNCRLIRQSIFNVGSGMQEFIRVAWSHVLRDFHFIGWGDCSPVFAVDADVLGVFRLRAD